MQMEAMPIEELETFIPLTAPAWQIVLMSASGEVDITQRINARLVSLSITDKSGVESDELNLVLDDDDGQLELPPTGALLAVSIGWVGSPLVNKGLFTIDEVEYSGEPAQLSLRGRGANVSKTLGLKKERSWHQIGLGNLATTIAAEHGLTAIISNGLRHVQITHADQTNESDVNFLTRIAKQHDAICTVKAERLLLTPAGQCTSASGKALAVQSINRRDCSDSYRYLSDDRSRYTGVRTYWHDPKASKRKSVLAGSKSHVKALRDTFPNATAALQAAKAELKRIKRGHATLSLTLAKGRPDIGPESAVTAVGFKAEISNTPWVATEATHNIGDSGFTTAVELETRQK